METCFSLGDDAADNEDDSVKRQMDSDSSPNNMARNENLINIYTTGNDKLLFVALLNAHILPTTNPHSHSPVIMFR